MSEVAKTQDYGTWFLVTCWNSSRWGYYYMKEGYDEYASISHFPKLWVGPFFFEKQSRGILQHKYLLLS